MTKLAAPVQGRPLLRPWSLYQQDLRLGVMLWLYENLSAIHQSPFQNSTVEPNPKPDYRRFAETSNPSWAGLRIVL